MPVAFTYRPPAIDGRLALAAVTQVAAHAGAEALLAASQPLVPVDTGELVASGKVTDQGEGRSAVSYSAIAKDGYDYAAIQHENLEFHHEHGQAKYLEQPMHSAHAEIAAAVIVPLKAIL